MCNSNFTKRLLFHKQTSPLYFLFSNFVRGMRGEGEITKVINSQGFRSVIFRRNLKGVSGKHRLHGLDSGSPTWEG